MDADLYPDMDTYCDGIGHTHSYAYMDVNSYSHLDRDLDSNGYTDVYAHLDTHGDREEVGWRDVSAQGA